LTIRDALSGTEQAYIDAEIVQNNRRILNIAQAAYEGRGVPVQNPLPILKKLWQPKKVHGRTDGRVLTGAEIAAKELNAREREQRLREREQHAIDLSLGPRISAADIPRFGPRDLAVITGEEVLLIRATPPPP
jgi:hypothetical protein